MWSAIPANNTGSDSKRYLSKYLVAVTPERSMKEPRMRATALMDEASLSRFISIEASPSNVLAAAQPDAREAREQSALAASWAAAHKS
ncbi:MAG: hypothetical protein WDA27_13795 [Actinomycetota bacterium]